MSLSGPEGRIEAGRTTGGTYLTGSESRLNFDRGWFDRVNTASSGVKLTAEGLWIHRVGATASIEVLIRVTVVHVVRPSNVLHVTVQSQRRGGRLPNLAASRCHGAIGDRMERCCIRTEVVSSFDYVDFVLGWAAPAQLTT